MKIIASCPRCRKPIVAETNLSEQKCPYCHQNVPTSELDPFDDGTGVKFAPPKETPPCREKHLWKPAITIFIVVGIAAAILSFLVASQLK
jgi:tRNA(Ile2) C34 agmatinyltransferase TiaS